MLLNAQVKPTGIVVEIVTVPVKPFSGATVMVDMAVALGATVTVVGLAVTVKSWIVNVTTAELEVPALAPVTVTT